MKKKGKEKVIKTYNPTWYLLTVINRQKLDVFVKINRVRLFTDVRNSDFLRYLSLQTYSLFFK